MDVFFNANSFRNNDLSVSNPRRNDHHVLLITSSGFPLSQIFVFRSYLHFSVYHDVVGAFTSDSWSMSVINLWDIFYFSIYFLAAEIPPIMMVDRQDCLHKRQ